MKSGGDQLSVRQHERLTCRLPAMLRIGEEHAKQITLSRTASDSNGFMDATVVDCSRGGLGVNTAVFLPRSCRVRVRLRQQPGEAAPDFEFFARVQRVLMIDRKPTYYLGMAFIPEGDDHAARIQKLLAYVNEHRAVETVAAPTATGSAGPGGRTG